MNDGLPIELFRAQRRRLDTPAGYLVDQLDKMPPETDTPAPGEAASPPGAEPPAAGAEPPAAGAEPPAAGEEPPAAGETSFDVNAFAARQRSRDFRLQIQGDVSDFREKTRSDMPWANKAMDTAFSLAGGVFDALDSTASALEVLTGKDLFPGVAPDSPSILPKLEGMDQEIIRAVGQFLTVFIPGAMALRGVRLAGAGLQGLKGVAVQGIAPGALADFGAFRGSTPSVLGALVNGGMLEENEFTTWVANRGEEADSLNARLKNAIEGAIIGGVLNVGVQGGVFLVKKAANSESARRSAQAVWQAITAARDMGRFVLNKAADAVKDAGLPAAGSPAAQRGSMSFQRVEGFREAEVSLDEYGKPVLGEVNALSKQLVTEHTGYIDSLSTKQEVGIANYTNVGSSIQNQILRGTFLDQPSLSMIDFLEGFLSVLDRAPGLEQGVIAHRGLQMQADVANAINQRTGGSREGLKESLRGLELENLGFTSTSLYEEIAAGFSELPTVALLGELANLRSLVRIQVPKGMRAFYVESTSSTSGERELVLGPGQRLRVLDADVSALPSRLSNEPSDFLMFDMEVVNPDLVRAGAKTKTGTLPLLDVRAFAKSGPQRGSNPGGSYIEPRSGAAWYIKKPDLPEQAQNEVLAANLYRLGGVETPEIRLTTDSRVASKMELKDDSFNPELADLYERRDMQQDFIFDVWLANWDVIGLDFDNVIRSNDGRILRLDTGGALEFRAMGDPKGEAFGDIPLEINTMRNKSNPDQPSTVVFGDISSVELVEGIERLAEVTPKAIQQEVEKVYGVGKRTDLVDKLIARRQYLLDLNPEDL